MTAAAHQTTPAPAAKCPRCDYDQRGVVAAWLESCPIQGTCSECGLAWQWAEVLNPAKYQPLWGVEFVSRVGQVPLAAIRTGIRSLWPWRFWLAMRMSQPIRWRRLALYILLWLLIPTVATYVVGQTGVALYLRWNMEHEMNQLQAAAPAALTRQQALLLQLQQADPEQYRRTNGMSIQRAIADAQSSVAYYQTIIAFPMSIQQPWFNAVYEAIAMPWGNSSSGVLSGSFGVRTYPPPRHLWREAEYSWKRSGRFRPWLPSLDVPASIGGFAWGCLLMFMLPASLVMLPVSRRKAKVGWRHIGRVIAYGLPPAIGMFWLCAAAWLAANMVSGAGARTSLCIQSMATGGLPLLMVIWWAVAIKRYLRMPHGAAVAVIMMILCVLVSGFAIGFAVFAMRGLFN